MLRLPPSDWQVLLEPDAVHAVRARRRWLPGRATEPERHQSAASWTEGLAALEAMLHGEARGARLHVTVSSRLSRYALVPWQAGLGAQAAQAYRRDCFARLYGDAALDWNIAAAPPTRQAPGLASAIDAALVAGLQALCGRCGARLAALQPQLAAVVERWRREMRAECFWLVLAEPGYLCLALGRKRAWRAVRAARPAGDTLAALAPFLARESLLADADAGAPPTQVYLWASGLETAGLDDVGGLPVTHLGAGR